MPHKHTDSKIATAADFFGKRKPTMKTDPDLAETPSQNVLLKPSLS